MTFFFFFFVSNDYCSMTKTVAYYTSKSAMTSDDKPKNIASLKGNMGEGSLKVKIQPLMELFSPDLRANLAGYGTGSFVLEAIVALPGGVNLCVLGFGVE